MWSPVKICYQTSLHDLMASEVASGYDPELLPDMFEIERWKATSQNTHSISFDASTGEILTADFFTCGAGNLATAGIPIELAASHFPFKSDWTQVACGSTPKYGHAATVINSEMHIYGGWTDASSILGDLWKYSSTSDTWEQISGYPNGNRANHTMNRIGQSLYIHGGYSPYSATLNDTIRFYYSDYDNFVWSKMADGIRARSKHCSAVSSGVIYVFGGQNEQGSLMQDLCRYDPSSNAWTEVQCHTTRRCNASMVALGPYLYIYGGRTATASGTRDALRYDTVNNSWSSVSTGPAGYETYQHAAVEVGSNMVMFGGSTKNTKMVVYSPGSDTYTYLADAPVGFQGHSLIWLYDRFYIHGGYTSDIDSHTNETWYTSGIRVASGSAEITIVVSAYVPGNDDLTLANFTSTSRRAWCLTIGAGSAVPYLGFMNWGQAVELGYLDDKSDPYEQEHKANAPVSRTGYLLGIWDRYTERQIDLRFSLLQDAAYEKISSFWNCNGLKNFVMQWEATSHASEYYLVHATGKIAQPFKAGGYYRDVRFSVRGRKT